jgi:hypothetical protein
VFSSIVAPRCRQSTTIEWTTGKYEQIAYNAQQALFIQLKETNSLAEPKFIYVINKF